MSGVVLFCCQMQNLNEDPNWKKKKKKSLLSGEVRQEERVLLCLLAWRQSVNL